MTGKEEERVDPRERERDEKRERQEEKERNEHQGTGISTRRARWNEGAGRP